MVYYQNFITYIIKIIKNGSCQRFDELNRDLLIHTDRRKEFIDVMDQTYLKIEDDRVENVLKYWRKKLKHNIITIFLLFKIRNIFNEYADNLFKINFLPRPEIEKLLDAELQVISLFNTVYSFLWSKNIIW